MAYAPAHFLPSDAHPAIKALVAHWLGLCPEQGLPGRQHFDPIQVPKLLANIWLLDVVRDPLRFRYRIFGSALVEIAGADRTGQWLHELIPNFESTIPYRDLKAVVESGVPSWRRGKPEIQYAKDFLDLERIDLPLATDGVTVDIIIGLTVYH